MSFSRVVLDWGPVETREVPVAVVKATARGVRCGEREREVEKAKAEEDPQATRDQLSNVEWEIFMVIGRAKRVLSVDVYYIILL